MVFGKRQSIVAYVHRLHLSEARCVDSDGSLVGAAVKGYGTGQGEGHGKGEVLLFAEG